MDEEFFQLAGMPDFSSLNCRMCFISPSYMNNIWLDLIADKQVIFLRFSSRPEYFLLFFWWIQCSVRLEDFLQIINEIFQSPGIFSSILLMNQMSCPFGRFSSVYQWDFPVTRNIFFYSSDELLVLSVWRIFFRLAMRFSSHLEYFLLFFWLTKCSILLEDFLQFVNEI